MSAQPIKRWEIQCGDRIRMEYSMYGIDITKEFTVDGIIPGGFLTNRGMGIVHTNEPAADAAIKYTRIEASA